MAGRKVYVGRVRISDVISFLSYFISVSPGVPREAVERMFVLSGVLTPVDVEGAYDRARLYSEFLAMLKEEL